MFIRTPALEVEVLPEIGGKVARLRDLHSGDDLLVRPDKPYRPLPHGAPWVDFDTSGMDECFPNVDEGPYPFEPWLDTPLPQMGEWVHEGWSIASADETSVSLERTGRVLPYVARKHIRFADHRTIRLDYSVRNAGEHAFRYIWSAHPLLTAGDTFDLRLPDNPVSFVTFPDDGAVYTWPRYHNTDLSHEWLPQGDTVKVFVVGLREGWCELETLGRGFRFDFDLTQTPVLGIWFNNYGFPAGRPFRCIAVEPCTSPSDVLHALPATAYPEIAPGETAAWWMTLRVG